MGTHTLRSSKLLAAWSRKLTPRTTQLDQTILPTTLWKARVSIGNDQCRFYTQAPKLKLHESVQSQGHLSQSINHSALHKQPFARGIIAQHTRLLSSKGKLNKSRSPISPVVQAEKGIRTEPDED